MGFHTHEILRVETEGKFRGKSDDKFLNNRLYIHVHFYMTNTVSMDQLPYSGKHSREKTFTNFMVLEPPAKVFSMKFGRAILTYDKF